MTNREVLHRLVDQLPESHLDTARQLLEAWGTQKDPVLKALMEAEEGNEPSTLEEDQEGHEAWEEYKRGIGKPWEKVRKGLAGGWWPSVARNHQPTGRARLAAPHAERSGPHPGWLPSQEAATCER